MQNTTQTRVIKQDYNQLYAAARRLYNAGHWTIGYKFGPSDEIQAKLWADLKEAMVAPPSALQPPDQEPITATAPVPTSDRLAEAVQAVRQRYELRQMLAQKRAERWKDKLYCCSECHMVFLSHKYKCPICGDTDNVKGHPAVKITVAE